MAQVARLAVQSANLAAIIGDLRAQQNLPFIQNSAEPLVCFTSIITSRVNSFEPEVPNLLLAGP